jgi:hypothetical protein
MVLLRAATRLTGLHFPTPYGETHSITIDKRQLGLRLDEEQHALLTKYCQYRDFAKPSYWRQPTSGTGAEEVVYASCARHGELTTTPEAKAYLAALDRAQTHVEGAQTHMGSAVDTYNAYLWQRGWTMDALDILEAELAGVQRDRQVYVKQWATRWQGLAALPQLFIAV